MYLFCHNYVVSHPLPLSLDGKMEEIIIFNNIEFHKIKDFNGYYISRCGKVLSTKRKNNIIMKSNHWKGYESIYLYYKYTGRKKYKVHRLVAQSFIPNPYNKLEVNHIDGNPSNNNVSNLEWVTPSENMLHAYYKLKTVKSASLGKFGKDNHSSKKVKQLDLYGNLIKVWYSMTDVQRELGIYKQNISNCCNGKIKTSGGFKWEYI